MTQALWLRKLLLFLIFIKNIQNVKNDCATNLLVSFLQIQQLLLQRADLRLQVSFCQACLLKYATQVIDVSFYTLPYRCLILVSDLWKDQRGKKSSCLNMTMIYVQASYTDPNQVRCHIDFYDNKAEKDRLQSFYNVGYTLYKCPRSHNFHTFKTKRCFIS